MQRKLMITAGLTGLMAVILGALGSHALQAALGPEKLNSFETGVRYQAWHALALLALSFSGNSLAYGKWIFHCWLWGVVLFSGSIYLLSTAEVTGMDVSFLGPVTPLGGLLMIAGWALVFASGLKIKGPQSLP